MTTQNSRGIYETYTQEIVFTPEKCHRKCIKKKENSFNLNKKRKFLTTKTSVLNSVSGSKVKEDTIGDHQNIKTQNKCESRC